MNIYVSHLSCNVQDKDLQVFFTAYGAVTPAQVVMDPFTGRSRGFGLGEMADGAEAENAIAVLNGAAVMGRALKVMQARPKEGRPARSSGYQGAKGVYKQRS